jgi:single-strand DNA-binding protein
MAGVNLCAFIGNVGRDPEMRSTKNGKDVCSFSIAVNERKDGEPLWLQVSVFDKLAATCKQYLSKGKQVYIQGRLQVRKYEKDGAEKTAVEIVANTVTFLGGRDDGGGKRIERAPEPSPSYGDTGDGDIPF